LSTPWQAAAASDSKHQLFRQTLRRCSHHQGVSIFRRQLVPGFWSSCRFPRPLLYHPNVESWRFLRRDFRAKRRVLPGSLSQPMARAWQPKEAPKFTQWHHSKDHFSCKAQNLLLGEPCRPALFSIFAPCSAASWSPAPFFSPASQPRGKEVVLPVSTVLDRFSPAPNLCRGNRCRQAT
jgi:hypothetical protein